jgi:hypothetical protein
VDFNLALVAGPLDFGNWTFRLTNHRYLVTVATAAAAHIDCGGAIDTGADPGPDAISYFPPPFDVRTPAGGLADLFTDYPITAP